MIAGNHAAAIVDLGEPVMGATASRLPQTYRDPSRAFLQLRGSPLDYPRLGRTQDSCLGVKGSPVQIRPSRRRSKAGSGFQLPAFGCNGSARALPSVA
jgi:hypothetical protein